MTAEMTTFEYALEIQKKSGPDALVTWLTVGELIDLIRPQEDFLNMVELTLTDPAHDAYGHPPAPLAEQVAAEVTGTNEKWMDVENQPKDWEGLPDMRVNEGSEMVPDLEAEHRDWQDWHNTNESNRP